ncbi:hypothetical protein J2W14_004251 [Pseudarthrobacter oxydans]|uniref:hypothetical protein n=1 Tax=Pseudarthrobacter oxydans TaxID=1671 RepID=UPI0027808EEA|nr:hypothetical protein [Pseudarthrobacter oxydans]MDP9984824.1 hypothetical protein [Pseudarthrobacter oxydans]
MITAILHLSIAATIYLRRSAEAVLANNREQIQAILAQHPYLREHCRTAVG